MREKILGSEISFYSPRECLKRRIGLVDLGPHPQEAHQRVGLVTGQVLRRIPVKQALESGDCQLEPAEPQVPEVVVDELAGLGRVGLAPDAPRELVLADSQRRP